MADYMNEYLGVANQFAIEGTVKEICPYGEGHINLTLLVTTDKKRYILQKMNTRVFPDPDNLMNNICGVTEHLKARGIETLSVVPTKDGKSFLKGDACYRVYDFIENTVTYQTASDINVFRNSGKAFGEFQNYLIDFPVEKLHIVIPHFHNTVMRYEALDKAIQEDAMGRAASVQDVIDGYQAIRDVATKPYRMQRAGILPLRVTHNDTKTSNVLFDAETNEKLAVIDLDTVMPGLVAFDFGDAIRVAGSTVDEDERDLSKVALDLEKYEAFTRGFVGEVGDILTEAEQQSLALGAVAMTAECGVRFLTDYLNGDKYFRIHYPDQNLARARCHLTLSNDMIAKLQVMEEIVKKYCK